MEREQPGKDWTRPVWVHLEAIEAKHSQVVEAARAAEVADYRSAVATVARVGMTQFLATLRQPDLTNFPDDVVAAMFPDRGEAFQRISARREQARLQMVEDLTLTRATTVYVTVRDAMTAYLAKHEQRVELKTGDWIDRETYKQMRKTLLAVFGLSSSEKMQPVRDDVPLDLDAKLASLDDETLEGFARFWHRMPAGVNSPRTVRNRLQAARDFFKWCDRKPYGFSLDPDTAKLLTAEDVETPAQPYDADQIKRILAKGKTRGGTRLRMYVLCGLLCGYTQVDCAEIAEADYLDENGVRYVHRYRSKEARPKRGSRPIKIKHWIPPELAALFDQHRATNAQRFLFNNENGVALTAKNVASIYAEAVADAGEDLSFKQLRKIGFNEIKKLSGSIEVADQWDGHAAGVRDNYDDGFFPPVIAAQQALADKLRADGVL
ncbi:MAG TPA: hypothetical protein VF624_13115 [Tepidisphaeraceae bacterium]|jgi:site-specific recombinase XerD